MNFIGVFFSPLSSPPQWNVKSRQLSTVLNSTLITQICYLMVISCVILIWWSLRRKITFNVCSYCFWSDQVFVSIEDVDTYTINLNLIFWRCEWHEENDILCCALASCKKIAWVFLRGYLQYDDIPFCWARFLVLAVLSSVILKLEFYFFLPLPGLYSIFGFVFFVLIL